MKTHIIEDFDRIKFIRKMDEFLADYQPEDIVDIEYARPKFGYESKYSALIITRK